MNNLWIFYFNKKRNPTSVQIRCFLALPFSVQDRFNFKTFKMHAFWRVALLHVEKRGFLDYYLCGAQSRARTSTSPFHLGHYFKLITAHDPKPRCTYYHLWLVRCAIRPRMLSDQLPFQDRRRLTPRSTTGTSTPYEITIHRDIPDFEKKRKKSKIPPLSFIIGITHARLFSKNSNKKWRTTLLETTHGEIPDFSKVVLQYKIW